MSEKRVIFLRIEPAGYMLDLLRALRETWPDEIETYFINASASQPWEFDPQQANASILPKDKRQAKLTIREKVVGAQRPALVHIAGWGDSISRTAISAAHSANIPVVVDHDTWTDAASGLARLAKRMILPRRFKKISHFAPAGQRQAAFLRTYGVKPSQMTPVNMTVDVLRIQRYLAQNLEAAAEFRKRFNLPEHGKILLFLGRLVPEKGLVILLECWKALSQSHTDTHLVIAGDGELMGMAEHTNSPTVHFIGRLAGDEVWNAYAAATVFVAPSHGDAWGLTINEAMAAGVPIAMTDAFGCIGDLAVADQTACIAIAGDVDDLHACLDKLLSDESYRRDLKGRALEVVANWTIEAQAARIAQIWQRELDSA